MITLADIQKTLNDPSPALTEDLAHQARRLTQQYFGRTIALYAPLYLSNYCSSHCTYCGFASRGLPNTPDDPDAKPPLVLPGLQPHRSNRIQRFKLTPYEMRREMDYLARKKIENILLLTGESYRVTPLSYLKEAVDIARDYFSSIALEVHPMNEEEYREIFLRGVDGITVYQETYNPQRYQEVHLKGKKADYDYRYRTPERAARAGIPHICLGILLGLAEAAADLHALYQHLRWMERHFPGIEYSLSFPRLRSVQGKYFAPYPVNDIAFIRILCLTRIHFPRVGINLSTRENPVLRDRALGLGVTRISAGSNTSVGGYSITPPDKQEPQFDIQDCRPVEEILRVLKQRHFDPVLTDWRRIPSEAIESNTNCL